MIRCELELWGGSDWYGSKQKSEVWEAKDKESLFLKILTENNRRQKSFHPNGHSGYAGSWKFKDSDWKLEEEYDAWWGSLSAEKKEEIYNNA